MRKAIVFAVIVAFVLSAGPLFAQGKTKAAPKEESLFQIMYNTVNVPCEKKAKTVKAPEGPSIFQQMSTSIKEGSAKAKQMSLRGQTMK